MIWTALFLSAICLLGFSPLYLQMKQGSSLRLVWKGLATLCAGAIALLAAPQGDVAWLAAAALVVCALADVLLEVKFLWGVGAFALGHGLYIAYFLSLAPFSTFHLLPISALMVISGCLLFHLRRQLGNRILPFGLYALILCIMGGTGVATGIALGGITGILVAAGGLIFLISDIFVLMGVLFTLPRALSWLGFYLYEIAQLLLAWSVLFYFRLI